MKQPSVVFTHMVDGIKNRYIVACLAKPNTDRPLDDHIMETYKTHELESGQDADERRHDMELHRSAAIKFIRGYLTDKVKEHMFNFDIKIGDMTYLNGNTYVHKVIRITVKEK